MGQRFPMSWAFHVLKPFTAVDHSLDSSTGKKILDIEQTIARARWLAWDWLGDALLRHLVCERKEARRQQKNALGRAL